MNQSRSKTSLRLLRQADGGSRGQGTIRFLSLLAILALPIRAFAAELPMFRGNLERTGAFPAARPGRWLESVKWVFATHGPVRGSATFTRDLVLFGSGDGNLYAVDVATGKERWRTRLDGAVHSTPAVDGEKVFAVSRRGGLLAIDLASGKQIWRFAIGPDLED
jgi:outer membrane protein assembly factor BamB